jgi:hypothetical protein
MAASAAWPWAGRGALALTLSDVARWYVVNDNHLILSTD